MTPLDPVLDLEETIEALQAHEDRIADATGAPRVDRRELIRAAVTPVIEQMRRCAAMGLDWPGVR